MESTTDHLGLVFNAWNERAEKDAVAQVAEVLELHTIFHAGLTAVEAFARLRIVDAHSWITDDEYFHCVRILNGVLCG